MDQGKTIKLSDGKSWDEMYDAACAIVDARESDAEDLRAACDILSDLARGTWWRCECGPVSPEAGDVDAVCARCGALLHLPERRPHSVWPLYVRALRRLRPNSWFDDLAAWIAERDLGHVGAAPQGPKRRECGGGAYPSAAKDSDAGGSGVLPQAIDGQTVETGDLHVSTGDSTGDLTPVVLPQAIAARGATPPAQNRAILCIDGMIIDENGSVRGCQWIALPPMPV